ALGGWRWWLRVAGWAVELGCFWTGPRGSGAAGACRADPTCLACGAFGGAAAVLHRPVVPHVLRAGRGPGRAGAAPHRGRMLLGAGLARAWPHDRAHYFFARARWEAGELGLAAARLVVLLLVAPGAPLPVAVDDSLFRRSGRRVHGAGWQHDGSAPRRGKLGFGNCF